MRRFQSSKANFSTLTAMDLLEYRDRFPILHDCTYLINHSLAAMPARAEDNLREYARMWRGGGPPARGGGGGGGGGPPGGPDGGGDGGPPRRPGQHPNRPRPGGGGPHLLP